jgi:hypothetical protein
MRRNPELEFLCTFDAELDVSSKESTARLKDQILAKIERLPRSHCLSRISQIQEDEPDDPEKGYTWHRRGLEDEAQCIERYLAEFDSDEIERERKFLFGRYHTNDCQCYAFACEHDHYERVVKVSLSRGDNRRVKRRRSS